MSKACLQGADDFLGKPFNREELSVRVRAGERVVGLEQKLQAQNATVEKAYAKLSQDLEAASNLQNSVLPAHDTTLGGVKFDWLFRPCHFVAGDHFNFFRINEFQTGFYLLDVVGHGVPAAMRSMTINHMLYPNYSCEEAEKLCHVATDPLSPSGVIRDLNLRFQDNLDTMFYFTIVYGIVDRARGRLSLTQAGHPSPIFIKRGGDASLLGKGGFPVGMLKDVEYDEISIDFTRGDRLLLYSDGVTECSNQDGLPFSTERLVGFLEESHQRPLKELMSDLGTRSPSLEERRTIRG